MFQKKGGYGTTMACFVISKINPRHLSHYHVILFSEEEVKEVLVPAEEEETDNKSGYVSDNSVSFILN